MSGSRDDFPALARRRQRAAATSVVVATSLVVLKFVAGILTNSLSLLASAVDSLTDILASTVNFFAIRTASRPADHDHEYGHGKAEGLAGLFQALVIGASGLYMGYRSVARIVSPEPLTSESIGIAVMIVSMLASLWLVRHLRRVAAETDSIALAADSVHYAVDVLANLGVLAALVVVHYSEWTIVDPLVSLAISIYIVHAGWGVLRESVDHLMDRALPPDVHDEIHAIVARHPTILGVHDLKTRMAGANRFIEMHLEIDGEKSLREAHDAAVAVLRDVESAIPNSRVFVHTDPVSPELDAPTIRTAVTGEARPTHPTE